MAVAAYRSLGVVQSAAADDGQGARAGVANLPRLVVEGVACQAEVIGIGGDDTVAVDQVAGADRQVARPGLGDGAAGVVEIGDTQIQGIGTQGAAPVDERLPVLGLRLDREPGSGGNRRLARCEVALPGRETDVGGASLAAAQIDGAAGQFHVAGGKMVAGGGDLAAGADGQIAAAGLTTVRLNTSRHCPAAGQCLCADGRIALGGQRSGIGHGTAGFQALRAGGIQAATVHDRGGDGLQVLPGVDRTAGVVELAEAERDVAAHGLHGAVGVVEGRGGDPDVLVARDEAAAVVEGLVRRDDQRAGAGVLDLTPGIVERPGGERQVLGIGGNESLRVVDATCHGQRHSVAASLYQLASDVAQVMRLQIELIGGEAGAVGAQGLRGTGREGAAGRHLGLAGVEIARRRAQVDAAGTDLSAIQTQRAAAQREMVAGDQLSVEAAASCRADEEITGVVERVVGGQSGGDQCSRGTADLTRRAIRQQGRVALRGDRAAIADIALGAQAAVATGVDRAAIVDAARRIELGLPGTGDFAGVAERTIDIHHNIASTGTDLAGMAHARPFSVPSRVIWLAYMPPSSLLSMAKAGVAPLPAMGVAVVFAASTWLAPVVTLSVLAQRPALSWTLRAMRSV